MNDISAATAGAGGRQPVEERLKKLEELKTNGMISQEEYMGRRQQILSEV